MATEIVRELVNGVWRTVTSRGGGGGSQPISCVLTPAAGIDLHGQSAAFFVWSNIYDNLNDMNPLDALPDGIGIDENSVGTDTLVTTEAGVLAFTLTGLAIQADATWSGSISFGNYANCPVISQPVVASGVRPGVMLSQVVELPVGAGFSLGIIDVDDSTANPMTVGGADQPALVIVRWPSS